MFCTYISHASAFESIFDKCVDQQTREIIRFKPDVIVGSSFGGFIALELIRRNIWRGPVVLLSSAHDKLSFISELKMYDMGETKFYNKVLSVVGKRDKLWFIYKKRHRVGKFFKNFEVLEFDDEHPLRNIFTTSYAKKFVDNVFNN